MNRRDRRTALARLGEDRGRKGLTARAFAALDERRGTGQNQPHEFGLSAGIGFIEDSLQVGPQRVHGDGELLRYFFQARATAPGRQRGPGRTAIKSPWKCQVPSEPVWGSSLVIFSSME